MRQDVPEIRPAMALRCREVVRRTGLSRATIYRLMARGEFPRQHRLSSGRVGWSEEEIEHWLRSRLNEARQTS
jgi:predicted DNA-binding transcriptional regulator AlpA